ncbi:MAG: hypothetical protein CMK92_06025 [Pseudomonas sp.]|nr:hypothetical protein [Pseudomonas sp.]
MILEETVTMCQDSHQLLLSTNKISDLVLKIEKLVSSCHRIEKSTGQLLGKTAILNIATQMMEIMGNAMDQAIKDPGNTEQFKNDAADSMIKMILDYQSGDDE